MNTSNSSMDSSRGYFADKVSIENYVNESLMYIPQEERKFPEIPDKTTRFSQSGKWILHHNSFVETALVLNCNMQLVCSNYAIPKVFSKALGMNEIFQKILWEQGGVGFGAAEFIFLDKLREYHIFQLLAFNPSNQLNDMEFEQMRRFLILWKYKEIDRQALHKGDLVIYVNRKSKVAHYAVMENSESAISKVSARAGVFRHGIDNPNKFYGVTHTVYFRKHPLHSILHMLIWQGMTACVSLEDECKSKYSEEEAFVKLKGRCLEILNQRQSEIEMEIVEELSRKIQSISPLDTGRLESIQKQYPPSFKATLRHATIKYLELRIRDIFKQRLLIF